MSEISDFITSIEQFADRHNLADTAVSKLLTNSPGYLARLRSGKDTGAKRIAKIKQKMAAYDAKMGKS